jgi:hypothetical protein
MMGGIRRVLAAKSATAVERVVIGAHKLSRGGNMAGQTGTVRVAGMVGLCWFLTLALATALGCASEKPKPMQQPSPEQVKGSADRSFDKLKQEERERKPAGL